MDYTTIILSVMAVGALVALAWLGGYEIGQANGITTERQSANRRVNGVLDSLNKRKPRRAAKRRASK